MAQNKVICAASRTIGLGLCSLLLVVFSGPALAWDWFDPDHPTWPGGVYEYRVNKSSFPASLRGNNMTADQYLWWINYGFSQWKERTGSLVYGHYLGTTSATPNTTDGVNSISAKTGCTSYSPGCSIWARTHQVWDAFDDFTEGDVTFFEGNVSSPHDWIVQTNSGSYFVGSQDFGGVATHEFGHILGLKDSANNIMQSANLGQNLVRYPVGDDIKGARTLYYNSGQPQIYWRKLTSSGWSAQSANPLPGWTQMHVTSAIGAFASTNVSKVVVGIWGTDQKMYWARADLPLSSSTSWSTVTAGASYLGWRPPAVAARKSGTPLWVSAWPNQWDKTNDSCPGSTILVSTDAFSSGTFYSAPGVCTVQTLALTHDPQSNKFVLAYVKRSGFNVENDKVYMTTSSDGVTWSAHVDVSSSTGTKLYGFDALGLACAPSGDCLLSYPYDGSNDPVLITRKFTVGSGGVSVASTWTSHSDKVQRTMPAAATSSGGSDRFMFAELWSTDPADWAESIGVVYTSTSSVVPYSSFDWQYTGVTTKHAPAIAAGSSLNDDTYIFYTQ